MLESDSDFLLLLLGFLLFLDFLCMIISSYWSLQVAVLADDILKNVEYDALRIVYNKFHSVVQFFPSTSTVLSPEVISLLTRFANTIPFVNLYVRCMLIPCDGDIGCGERS